MAQCYLLFMDSIALSQLHVELIIALVAELYEAYVLRHRHYITCVTCLFLQSHTWITANMR